jgi:hypothetical protein
MIYWDLDGVLRNLQFEIYGSYPNKWDAIAGAGRFRGLDVFQAVAKDKRILLEAQPTEYLTVARIFEPITILTTQPRDWKPYTRWWVRKWLNARVIFIDKPEDKLSYLQSAFLIEDYPFFRDYSNIILIDRPYNQETNCEMRIKNPKQLLELLKKLGYNNKK